MKKNNFVLCIYFTFNIIYTIITKYVSI